MMLYKVEFSQDGKIFDDYIGDYVKAWNTEEAKDYALTWYIEQGGKEEDIEDIQVSLHDIENDTMDLICSYMNDEIRERLSSETWENNLDFLIAYCEEDDSLKDILENEFSIELQEEGNDMSKIYYENTYTYNNGIEWLSINGDTDYPLNEWTKEEAREDYLSPKSETERQVDFMRAYGFYD